MKSLLNWGLLILVMVLVAGCGVSESSRSSTANMNPTELEAVASLSYRIGYMEATIVMKSHSPNDPTVVDVLNSQIDAKTEEFLNEHIRKRL